MQLQDHVSDNNDSDYQPSPQRAKRSEASGRKSHSNRQAKLLCVVKYVVGLPDVSRMQSNNPMQICSGQTLFIVV